LTAEPEFTLGIEEEYFLVDRATREVVGDPPDTMLAAEAIEFGKDLCRREAFAVHTDDVPLLIFKLDVFGLVGRPLG